MNNYILSLQAEMDGKLMLTKNCLSYMDNDEYEAVLGRA